MGEADRPPAYDEYESLDLSPADPLVESVVGASNSAHIVVQRRQPIFSGLLARYYVFIDDFPCGQLFGASQIELNVSPGRHTIVIKGPRGIVHAESGRAVSNELDLSAVAGQTYRLECKNGVPLPGLGVWSIATIGSRPRYQMISLYQVSDS